jgi:hypothetical protein
MSDASDSQDDLAESPVRRPPAEDGEEMSEDGENDAGLFGEESDREEYVPAFAAIVRSRTKSDIEKNPDAHWTMRS